MCNGKIGENYNIPGQSELANDELCDRIANILGKEAVKKYIHDDEKRPGHDLRYAIDANKIMKELGWEPSLQFAEGLEKTVDCYLANEKWLHDVTSGAYQEYYSNMYQGR
jgi:dTDP-glucose 4,6-dehydratase